eukprot:gene17473-20848_t
MLRTKQSLVLLALALLFMATCTHGQASNDTEPHECPPAFLSDMTGLDSENSLQPMKDNALIAPKYQTCILNPDQMAYIGGGGGGDIDDESINTGGGSLSLGVDSCDPTTNTCGNKKFLCSEAQVATRYGFSNFTCTLKASTVKGVISKCYAWDGNLKISNMAYIIIDGANLTYPLSYGVWSRGENVVNERTPMLPGLNVGTTFNTYTIVWASNKIDFLVNNVSFVDKRQYPISNNMPITTTLVYYVSNFVGNTKSLVGDDLPTTSTVKAIIVEPDQEWCNVSSSAEEWRWRQSSPLAYFTSNCTNWRPEWIFNDSMGPGWVDESTSFHSNHSTETVRRGTNSFTFDVREQTRIWFRSKKPFLRNHYKFLSFWINGKSFGNQQLEVWVTSNRTKVGSVNLNDYIKGGMEINTWYKVVIPIKKFQVNPPTLKTFDGFYINEVVHAYSGSVALDDIQVNNGSVCMEDLSAVYAKGKLAAEMENYSIGSIDLLNKDLLFRGNPTISWVVHPESRVNFGFKNGTVDTTEFQGIVLTLFFKPNPHYQYPNLVDTPDNSIPQAPPRQVKAYMYLTANNGTQLPSLGLAEYVGGEFPASQWIELLIPWDDLGVWEGAEVDGIKFQSDINEYQGTFHIGRIERAKWVPAHADEEDSSFASRSSTVSMVVLVFSIIVSLLL